MTEIQPPQPPDSHPPYQLDYESSAFTRPLGGVPFLAQLAIGVGACSALVVLTIFMTIGGEVVGFVIGCVMLLGLLCFAAGPARQDWHWPGLLVGVLITLGSILLACGLCIASMK